jgi:hypothetical protein
MTTKKDVSLYAPAKNPTDLAAVTDDLITNPPHEMSSRQRRIVNYRMRGLTQKAIGDLEGVSQPMIAKELNGIRKIYKEQGRNIDSDQVVGESVSLYQEVEHKAWEIFHTHKKERPSAANKALDTIMASREKTIKLMMDLGILKKAATEVEHTLNVAPFVERFSNMSSEKKQEALGNVITVNLEELEEPEPPMLLEDNLYDLPEEDEDGDEEEET